MNSCRMRAPFAPRARAAAKEGRKPNLIGLLNSWGGVTIAYRRRMIDSPSYTLNHEEVWKALEEGIRFAECLTPESVEVDSFGHALALHVMKHTFDPATGKMSATGEPVRLPAKSILVAAGTQPNTVLGREDPDNVFLDGKWFQAVDEDGQPVKPERVAKPKASRVLTSIRPDGRGVSFFGDLHPSYAGNVVKAMASAKQGYPVVTRLLSRRAPEAPEPGALVARLNSELRAVVKDVIRLTPNIVEVVVQAPMAARAFEPGMFYRLQNYETLAPRVNGTTLAMEGLALTGASVDRDKGLALDDCSRSRRLVGSVRSAAAGRTGDPDGADRYAHRNALARNRAAGGRRAGQCRVVLHRPAASRQRIAHHLLRRLQENDRPLQGGGDREGRRRSGLVLRRSARIHARSGAGQGVRRKHRGRDGGLRPRPIWEPGAGNSAECGGPAGGDRLRRA